MADMFNVPQQVEGPLAGYMRGIQGDYAIQQANQEAERRGISNQRDQTTLDQLIKDQPLFDQTRANTLAIGQDDAANMSNILDKRRAGVEADTEKARSEVSVAKMLKLDNQGKVWLGAAQAMEGVAPADIHDTWERQKEIAKEQGIKNFPDSWDGQGKSFTMSRANAYLNTREQLNAKTLDTFKTKNNIEEFNKTLEGKIQIAKASAAASGNNALNLARTKMTPKEYFYDTIRDKQVITPAEVERAVDLEKEEIQKQNPTLKAQAVAQAASQFAQKSSKEKAAANKAIGLPEKTEADDYARKKIEDEIDSAARSNVKNAFATKAVDTGKGPVPLSDFIESKKGTGATVVPGVGGHSDKKAHPMPTSKSEMVKDRIYDTAKGPAIWTGTSFIPASKSQSLTNYSAPPLPTAPSVDNSNMSNMAMP
jgi:hypothetical protein